MEVFPSKTLTKCSATSTSILHEAKIIYNPSLPQIQRNPNNPRTSVMEETIDQNPNTIANGNLNDLPEELLLRILTFLPTLESAQTSLVSQRWKPLWSRVPSLTFLYDLFPPYQAPVDTRQFFAEYIDRVLISRSSRDPDSPIHAFRLSFIYNDHYGAHVDSWVRHAVNRLHTRELHLDFFIHRDFHNLDHPENDHRYDFPFSVLRYGFVEILRLRRCHVTLPAKMPAVGFRMIRSMVLDRVFLADEFMRDLILGCPNLEALELQDCWGHHHLKIRSARLKRLVLGYFYDSELKETILVDCPNLCFISFDCCDFDKFLLKNASSLVEFHVFIVHLIDRAYRSWDKVVRLLEQAPSVEHLSVQNWWFKFLTSKDPFPKSFMLQNLKLLELRTGFTQYDLLGMAALLKLCPNLETMILEYLYKIEEDETLSEEFLDKPVDFSMPSLKQVTMKAYTGSEDEANFVRILISQGVVLEKIVLALVKVDENGLVVKTSFLPIVLCKTASQSWEFSPIEKKFIKSSPSSATPNSIHSEL